MASTILDPGEQMLADAADLIEVRGWDLTTDPYAESESGALSVLGALEQASNARDWHADRPEGEGEGGAVPPVTADDGLCVLAAYVIDTVYVPMHSALVAACPACTQCRKHSYRPLTLILNQECPDGCVLCDEHHTLSDPHGYHAVASEEVVGAWERFMPHQRDVISGLRAAAARPAL